MYFTYICHEAGYFDGKYVRFSQTQVVRYFFTMELYAIRWDNPRIDLYVE
jgi:hypothetical protein